MIKDLIENFENLTEDEKYLALTQLKKIENNPILQLKKEKVTSHPAANFFKENHWVKIENFINKEVCLLLYHHVILNAKRLSYLEELDNNYDKNIWGTFDDHQALGDFSKYGDPIFDALLDVCTDQMKTLTDKDLIPTYSYHRLYTTGTELKRHKDRPSCEISTTLCLGYDTSNIDKNKYPNWNWPMFVGPRTGEEDTDGLPISMKPGDMIIYRGCEIEHWREPFIGNNHAQVFLHYNEKDGEHNIKYDSRPILGLPNTYRKKQ